MKQERQTGLTQGMPSKQNGEIRKGLGHGCGLMQLGPYQPNERDL